MVEEKTGEVKRMSPLRAIRKKCLDCSGTWHEVKLCTVEKCPLYVFRLGKNPFRTKREYTEEEREALRVRLALARERRVNEDGDVEELDDEIAEIDEELDEVEPVTP